MSTELTAKFLQHLNRNQREKGFTLVELLVVIIIIGILAAISLPNYLNQSAKAKQTEAKQNIGMINRVQNISRSQNNQFASSFEELAIGNLTGGITATTKYYDYTLNSTIDNTSILAQAKDTAAKGYSGASNRYTNSTNRSVVSTILCEAVIPGTTAPTTPVTPANAPPTCTAPYVAL